MNKWFLLPGMGATAAMYNALRHKLDFEINFINWPRYCGEKSYAEIAERVIKEYKIENGDILGGSSLGGMIALEMGQIIQPKGIILIGSAVSPSEVQGLITKISQMAVIVPISIIQMLAGKQKGLVSKMFADSDTDFIRAVCSYLRSWTGYRGPMEIVYRLHGKQDHVIPCPPFGANVVDNAGHLISMTHASETAAFLAGVRAQIVVT